MKINTVKNQIFASIYIETYLLIILLLKIHKVFFYLFITLVKIKKRLNNQLKFTLVN